MRELSLVLFLVLSLFLTPYDTVAQKDNSGYFLITEGAKTRLGHFNRRQRPLGFTEYKVLNVKENEIGKDVVLKISHFDRLNNPLSETELTVKYKNGDVILPAEYLLFIELPEHSESLDMDSRNRELVIPGFLGNGMNLTPSFIELNNEQSLIKVTDFSRTVNNFENVATAAGDFASCVITSKREVLSDKMEVYTVYTWLSQGVGPVKMRYYDERLKLVKYSEILEFTPGRRM